MRGKPGKRVLPITVSVGLLALLPFALVSPVLGLFAIALAAFVVFVVAVGVERAGACCMVAAGFVAPINVLKLGPFYGADLLLIAGITLLVPAFARNKFWAPGLFWIGAGTFAVFGLLSSLGAANPSGSIGLLLLILIALVGVPLAFVWWQPPKQWLVAVAGAYVFGTAVSVLGGFLTGEAASGRMDGLTRHVNVLGLTGLLALGLCPYLWLAVERRHRWLVVLGALFATSAIWFSGSRAAFLAAILAGVLFVVWERSIGLALFLAAAAAVALGRLPTARAEGGESAFDRLVASSAGAGRSNEARADRAGEAIDSIREHPWLGTGFDFLDVFSVHSTYLQAAYATGLVGGLGFALCLIGFALAVRHSDAAVRVLAYPALAYILAGPVSPQMSDRYVVIPLGLALVGAWKTREDRLAASEPEPTAPSENQQRETERWRPVRGAT